MSTLPIPERNMIDIHMHLIPGVDDGAADMEMAQEMMRMAREQGITRIIATPHSDAFRYSAEGGRIAFRQLLDHAAKNCPEMKLYLGCEVYCDAAAMDQVVELLNSGRYPTVNGSKYVLTEFSMWVEPEQAEACVVALVEAGYIPVIAHMERYRNLRENMDLVNRFRELGALIQLNAYSLSGEKDEAIRDWARHLVLERKADFLGTDAHRTWHRPPSAAHGLKWLYEHAEPEYADAIAWKNAQLILLDPE